MDPEELIQYNTYIEYINHNKQIKVIYLDVESSNGLTFYKFKDVENNIIHPLFDFEVVHLIKNIQE